MFKKLFAAESDSFFRKIDWAAFWTATVISFLVYFLTLGPSVTLEDSGELAVAGDHLGVPHPPGYPIWTMCAYLFSRLFSWVSYMGQPTPAWSISLMSAVFAALAAGITAMLITRSASDMVRHVHGDSLENGEREPSLLCWAGGVGGSLVFAFSPVMWSQATIVEVYTLNAFFLMWIFLLTYRWMRRPSDKILWLTAFVFGLGLTNYQVLLLAALPLVIVIFLRNIALFRDFLLVGIPVLLTAHVLQIGAELPAQPGMAGPAYAKLPPMVTANVPSAFLLGLGLGLVFLSLVFALVMRHVLSLPEGGEGRLGFLGRARPVAGRAAAGGIGIGSVLLLLSALFSHSSTFSPDFAPLLSPAAYTGISALVGGILAVSVGGAFAWRERWNDKGTLPWLIAAGALSLLLLVVLGSLPSAVMPGHYTGASFSWSLPSLALFAGLAVLFILGVTVPRGLFYAIPVAALQIALFVILRKGGLNGLTHPTTWWFWWPVVWNFAVIGLAWLMLPNGRNVALTTFFAELGVAFYAYMPIVSDLRNPPMNWGYPRTWEGFKHAITRGQYEKIAPSDIFSPKFRFQLGSYFTDLRVQFTLVAATLGFLPFTLWSFKAGKKRFRALYVASGLYLLISGLVILSELVGGEPVFRLDKFFMVGIFLLLLVGIGAIMVQQFSDFLEKTWKSHTLSEGVTVTLSLAGIALVACIFLTRGFSSWFSGGAGEAGFGVRLAALLLSVLIVAGVGGGAFLLKRIVEKRVNFKVDMDTVTQQWLIATAAGFLVMSVLLVALANIKGDLQDAFIQKVKFISSHGLFAIWIGYGLSFGLVIANRVLEWAVEKRKMLPPATLRPLRILLITAGVCIALIPISENYRNEWLVFAMSGAEQNGHTFGWQFGNYQLRGAEAVAEELDADEEPLPNPLYPPGMGPDAVFFGGTDPGRFVPTYMIYSAHVRPDVFLITQNALADNTYMSTMRDLYGNAIWIPTTEDSANAFKIYVDEVKAGKRPKNAALTVENGRVQVSGALGVMEINGILCDMIFQKNKARHPFYVEESYVIKWMFPYLTPHGLIMKINNEKCRISEGNVRDDMDFWDWYTRRLIRDPMFRRDLPAQKSFSKLRSAIAGLYMSRGMAAEGERAFQEACALYPVSPESNFRLIQEVLLPQQRYTESLDLLAFYNTMDPNNTRGKEFSKFIMDMERTRETIARLTRKTREKKQLSLEEVFQLARAYQRLGQNDAASAYVMRLAQTPGIPPSTLYELALMLGQMNRFKEAVQLVDRALPSIRNRLSAPQLLQAVRIYGQAQEVEKMADVLNRYLQLMPNDWQAWLNMATVSLARKQQSQAQFAIQKALQYGQGAAFQAMQEHPVLKQIALRLLRAQEGRGRSGGAGRGILDNGFLGPRR